MVPSGLIPVLGHARVLDEGLPDPRRRVLAYERDNVVGAAAFEPLFGPHAEGVIALREGDSSALIPYLLDELIEQVQHAGLVAVRFVFGSREQQRTAERLSELRSHCELRRDWLDIRLAPAGRSAARGAAA